MGNVQIIRTEGGEELVVLSRNEYDALVSAAGDADEDAADLAMYDSRKAALTSADDVLPAEVSELVLRGQTRLKAVRMWRRVAQGDVAARVGIAQGYLSDLENGRRSGSSDTLERLAGTLDVPLKWLA